jgi:hypothetical protein
MLILLNSVVRKIFSEECQSWSSSLCSLIHSPVILFLLGSNIFFVIPLSNTLSLCSSHSAGYQVSHPHKNNMQGTGSIYFDIFILRQKIRKTKGSGPMRSGHSVHLFCS